ncbi:MAG: hypothetical protein JST68_20180 [Bacteroidetes bacterium]|nr:hypothetical protein [Bacteroidota bacterium]
MRYKQAVKIAVAALLLFSCKKDHNPPVVPPPAPAPKILLKEINITGQRPPFYHFDYNSDSTVSQVVFASGLAVYDVLYSGNKIAEMRDKTPVNKDTLRYAYNSQGKLSTISIIDDDTHVVIRHVVFTFDGDLLKKIAWDHKEDKGFVVDKAQQFDYYADGNLKTKIGLLRDLSGEFTDTTRYEQYDNKINVDDFTIVNGSVNEHVFLFQGFRLQKNNPGKVTFTQPSGLNNSITTYTYTYNQNNTPSKSTGDIFVNGTGAGSGAHVPFTTDYTYY